MISPGPEDSVPVNSSVLLMKTLSHYYCFLHHVCWPVSYRHWGWQQTHCRPITNSPTVISNSCFLIINIILTYFNDALNSFSVKQCALSVWGCEHSVAHKNNLTTSETNPIVEDGRMIAVAHITSQEYCSTYITKSFWGVFSRKTQNWKLLVVV